MSPREAISRHYIEQSVFTFPAIFASCERWGFLVDTDELFVACVPVERKRLDRKPLPIATPSNADCWYVAGLAGDVSKAWTHLPYKLKWVAYERGKVLRVWELQRIYRKTWAFADK
jgi:hypothetical protein